jgi:autotransporter-associated beta strand protein
VLSGQNTYSGSTAFNTLQSVGILGVGSSSIVTSGSLVSGPLGTGTLTLSNGSFVMAHGAARSVANPVSWPAAATVNFGGDYDLTFSGSIALGTTTSQNTIDNVASPGATLIFDTLTANSVTSGGLTVAGRGNTTIGAIASSNASNSMTISKNDTGTLTLGAGPFANRGNTTVSGGVLLLSTTAAVTGTNARPYTVSAGGAVATGFALAVVTFAIVFGAFAANVLYGAMRAVPTAQIETAEAFGMTRRQTFWRILVPQMWVYALPGLSNLWMVLIKASPLLFLLGIQDIVYWARELGGAA